MSFFFLFCVVLLGCVFFFQAEDGIRDRTVTGVQTCALPISWATRSATSLLLRPRRGSISVFLAVCLGPGPGRDMVTAPRRQPRTPARACRGGRRGRPSPGSTSGPDPLSREE